MVYRKEYLNYIFTFKQSMMWKISKMSLGNNCTRDHVVLKANDLIFMKNLFSSVPHNMQTHWFLFFTSRRRDAAYEILVHHKQTLDHITRSIEKIITYSLQNTLHVAYKMNYTQQKVYITLSLQNTFYRLYIVTLLR